MRKKDDDITVTITEVDFYCGDIMQVEVRKYEACKTCPDHICCSTFEIPLTVNEIIRLRHNPQKLLHGTSVIERDENGTCIYKSKEGCSIYNDRPIACMEYVCKRDKRIEIARRVKEDKEKRQKTS